MCWASEIDVTAPPAELAPLRSSLPADQATYVTGEVYGGTRHARNGGFTRGCAAVTEPDCVFRRGALTAFEDQARFSS
jgi:hypothetical protein